MHRCHPLTCHAANFRLREARNPGRAARVRAVRSAPGEPSVAHRPCAPRRRLHPNGTKSIATSTARCSSVGSPVLRSVLSEPARSSSWPRTAVARRGSSAGIPCGGGAPRHVESLVLLEATIERGGTPLLLYRANYSQGRLFLRIRLTVTVSSIDFGSIGSDVPSATTRACPGCPRLARARSSSGRAN